MIHLHSMSDRSKETDCELLLIELIFLMNLLKFNPECWSVICGHDTKHNVFPMNEYCLEELQLLKQQSEFDCLQLHSFENSIILWISQTAWDFNFTMELFLLKGKQYAEVE